MAIVSTFIPTIYLIAIAIDLVFIVPSSVYVQNIGLSIFAILLMIPRWWKIEGNVLRLFFFFAMTNASGEGEDEEPSEVHWYFPSPETILATLFTVVLLGASIFGFFDSYPMLLFGLDLVLFANYANEDSVFSHSEHTSQPVKDCIRTLIENYAALWMTACLSAVAFFTDIQVQTGLWVYLMMAMAVISYHRSAWTFSLTLLATCWVYEGFTSYLYDYHPSIFWGCIGFLVASNVLSMWEPVDIDDDTSKLSGKNQIKVGDDGIVHWHQK